jgi:hypothetical protein
VNYIAQNFISEFDKVGSVPTVRGVVTVLVLFLLGKYWNRKLKVGHESCSDPRVQQVANLSVVVTFTIPRVHRVRSSFFFFFFFFLLLLLLLLRLYNF